MPFEAEPLEEAGVGGGSGDERRDELPALSDVVHFGNRSAVSLAMLADEPDEYLEVTNTPVPLELVGLSHPNL